MPELPEVETIARGLRAHLPGRRIAAAEVRHPAVLGGSSSDFADALAGARIEEIRRTGKFLVLGLEKETRRLALIIHLGMTGQLLLSPPDAPVQKHTHLILALAGAGLELRYRDIRRFGRIRLLADDQLPEFFAHLGQDPFEITPEELRARLRGRKAPIKSLLLNQTILRGLGNIYADESLFAAGIHPQRRAGALARSELGRLLGAIRRVLARAIAHRGSSISNYITAEGASGDYQRRHRVYRKRGRPCPRCGTLIERVIVAGRSSHFCPRCQPRSPRCQPRRVARRRGSSADSRVAVAVARAHD